MASLTDIATVTAKLSAAYPNWNLTEYTNDVYYEDLKDLPTDLLFAAAQHCRTSVTRDQRFAPSAGEIRVAAVELKCQADGIPSALEAWSELLKVPKSEEYVKKGGMDSEGRIIVEYIKYQWSHPLVRKVAIAMGFPKFPDWEKESYERSAFMKAYQVELSRFLTIEAQPDTVKQFVSVSLNNRIESGISAVTKQLSKG